MKLAILGPSPIALEAALRFHYHGASLTLFWGEGEPVGWEESPDAHTGHLGKRTLIETGVAVKEAKNWEEWQEFYKKPILNFLRQHQMVKAHEVVSVSKRFLSPDEEIPGKSRFYDLFRVIYEMNPQEFIQEQRDTNPELYQKLSQELVGSLQTTLEMYEDFDVVIDCRYPAVTKSMATSGRALGEKRIDPSKVIYGLKALRTPPQESDRDIALIGSGKLASEVLLKLSDWLRDPRMNLFVISSEPDPFAAEPKVKPLLEEMDREFSEEIGKFEMKLREWQELDDFVKAKVPKPAEPIPRLNFFSGHNASAVDELIDKKRLFLTLEHPDFREGKKHPANNLLDLKTIGVDRVYVVHDPVKKNITENLRVLERGYFDLLPTVWARDLEILQGIEHEIFTLFSPRSPQ